MAIVKLENVRLSFPDLFEAKQFEGSGPFYYGAAFLMPEDHPVLVQQPDQTWKKSTVAKVILAVATEAWKGKAQTIVDSIRNNPQKCCWYDGNIKEYDGYEGNFALNAKREQSKGRPVVKDRDASPLESSDGKPYAGCYVNASVEFWAQDNKFGKGIRSTLRGVQFVKDGDAFSAGSPMQDDEFGAIDAPETEDDIA